MAITSEIIGKLGGGADVEVVPVSGTLPGGNNLQTTLHTVQIPNGETWLVSVIGTITSGAEAHYDASWLEVGGSRGYSLGLSGVSAVVTGTVQVKFGKQYDWGYPDTFTGHVYAVKL